MTGLYFNGVRRSQLGSGGRLLGNTGHRLWLKYDMTARCFAKLEENECRERQGLHSEGPCGGARHSEVWDFFLWRARTFCGWRQLPGEEGLCESPLVLQISRLRLRTEGLGGAGSVPSSWLFWQPPLLLSV